MRSIQENNFLMGRAYSSVFSSAQLELDGALESFTRESTDFASLATMMAGALANRVGKVVSLALIPKIFSPLIGLTCEVTAFEGTSLLFSSHSSPLTPHSCLASWRNSFFNLGVLKGMGHLLRSQNFILQHFFQDLSMVAGNQFTSFFEWTPQVQGSFLEQVLHAEVVNNQLAIGNHLAGKLTGNRVNILESNFEFNLRAPRTSSPDFSREILLQVHSAEEGSNIASRSKFLHPRIPAFSELMGEDFLNVILREAGGNEWEVVERSEVRQNLGTYWMDRKVPRTSPEKIVTEYVVDGENQAVTRHYLSIQDHRSAEARNLWSCIFKLTQNRKGPPQIELSWVMVHPDLRGNGFTQQAFTIAVQKFAQIYPSAIFSMEVHNFRVLKSLAKFRNLHQLRMVSRDYMNSEAAPQRAFLEVFTAEKTGLCSRSEAQSLHDARIIKASARYAKVIEILEREYLRRKKWDQNFTGNILSFLFERFGDRALPLLDSPDQGTFYIEFSLFRESSSNGLFDRFLGSLRDRYSRISLLHRNR